MKSKVKISYYLSHPIQYFTPLLREMAKEFDLKVYYFSDVSFQGGLDKGFGQNIKWDIPLLEGYSSAFLRNISPRGSVSNHLWDLINPGVVTTLIRDNSRIIIVNGWSYFSTLLTILLAKLLGKSVWVRAENSLSRELLKGRMLLIVKKMLFKNFLLRFVNKFLFIGDDNMDFFLFYGVSPERLIYTPYAVDNDYFSKCFEDNRTKRKALMEELSLPANHKIILFTGKYIPVKRPIDLIKAFQCLESDDVALVMVGEGELRREMEAYIEVNRIQKVFLTGFVNQSKISKYYSTADVFVLCSESETWGLSINEAMNFELPIVASDTVSCSKNLVVNGENGFIFKMGNISELANCLRRLLVSDERRLQAGKRSSEVIKSFNHLITVKNLKDAILE